MLETISTATLDHVTGGADATSEAATGVISQLADKLPAGLTDKVSSVLAEAQKQAKPWIDALGPVLASSRGVIMNFVPNKLPAIMK